METRDLYIKLKEAYSNQNLTRITITLINLYKEKQFGILAKIAEIINETHAIEIDPEARYFSKLMMLYHPDRGNFHRQEIDRLVTINDYNGLSSYVHILSMESIEEIAVTLGNFEDIDYSPVYEWDINTDDFIIITEDEKPQQEKKYRGAKKSRGISFYDAYKIRMYGNTHVEFLPHYLEDIEEFELAHSGIDDLDGVQYCIHAVSLNLSGNSIEDISRLWGLKQLLEIDLSDNKISDVDTLSNLKNLRTLNLSNNTISDISSLMNLENLEYLDISGIKAPHDQIRVLEELGITVIRNQ
ncbi:MAG: leucine-rich repeat domain-containing protein [Bacteroidales bacterium]|nr:leucine-rich repeat domain-containing protein [Bacteroidales bacterium]